MATSSLCAGDAADDARDAPAGDTDYGRVGAVYSAFRQPEPSIAALIESRLGAAITVLNVGAGAGSYEPLTRQVTPVEPSAEMRALRPGHLARAIDATAERLPFDDNSFDASMSTFSVHQWSDAVQGLREMRRVTRGPVVILSCDPSMVDQFWLNRYAPLVLAAEKKRYPAIDLLSQALGGAVSVLEVPIPLLCRDGFNEAYYGRPELFLETPARLACSAWSFVDASETARNVEQLRADLASGQWDRCHGELRHQALYLGSLRLIVA